jgi:hypothetical protein
LIYVVFASDTGATQPRSALFLDGIVINASHEFHGSVMYAEVAS